MQENKRGSGRDCEKSGWRQYLYIGKPHDLLQAETIVILLDMRTLHVETGKTDKACDPDRDR
ncbi:hypothetical protein AGR2A_Lc90074 [Agrobacterium genomosp. 2 str. CFBP 5494]|uniref:Uncharacterized protein n=1 Tax=Agrobacterium genomosp. 2 str. CFBP 5494 TaxID=1183436 RepID=A0A9W5F521_9HYPH|nr:hypothetical protein AGR2A_Lc90074 [Agrobacterium genomosp. 2 str. CFBP 5494]